MDSLDLDYLSMPPEESSYHDASTIEATFQQIWTKRALTDIDFEIKNEKEKQIFRAHKLVLCLWSPVFADMFYGNKAKNAELISLTDVDSVAFRFSLRYMYGYPCSFRKYKHAFRVYKVAEKYQIEGLQKKARGFILSAHVTKENALDLLEPASYFNSKSLKERCFKIIQSETAEVLRVVNPYYVSSIAIETMLSMERLALPTEYQLIEWIFAWGKNQYFKQSNCSCEREILDPFLPSLRFHDLTCDEFASLVKAHRDFFRESEAFSFFMNISCPGSWPLPEWVDTSKPPRLYKNKK